MPSSLNDATCHTHTAWLVIQFGEWGITFLRLQLCVCLNVCQQPYTGSLHCTAFPPSPYHSNSFCPISLQLPFSQHLVSRRENILVPSYSQIVEKQILYLARTQLSQLQRLSIKEGKRLVTYIKETHKRKESMQSLKCTIYEHTIVVFFRVFKTVPLSALMICRLPSTVLWTYSFPKGTREKL